MTKLEQRLKFYLQENRNCLVSASDTGLAEAAFWAGVSGMRELAIEFAREKGLVAMNIPYSENPYDVSGAFYYLGSENEPSFLSAGKSARIHICDKAENESGWKCVYGDRCEKCGDQVDGAQ